MEREERIVDCIQDKHLKYLVLQTSNPGIADALLEFDELKREHAALLEQANRRESGGYLFLPLGEEGEIVAMIFSGEPTWGMREGDLVLIRLDYGSTQPGELYLVRDGERLTFRKAESRDNAIYPLREEIVGRVVRFHARPSQERDAALAELERLRAAEVVTREAIALITAHCVYACDALAKGNQQGALDELRTGLKRARDKLNGDSILDGAGESKPEKRGEYKCSECGLWFGDDFGEFANHYCQAYRPRCGGAPGNPAIIREGNHHPPDLRSDEYCAGCEDCQPQADAGEPTGGVARPKIVCLCGSTRFMEAFFDEGWRETLEGNIVLSVGVCKHAEDHGGEALGQEVADMLDELHLRKIDLADEVLILNVGGYIGESTGRELEYAWKLGKPIRFLEPTGGVCRTCFDCGQPIREDGWCITCQGYRAIVEGGAS